MMRTIKKYEKIYDYEKNIITWRRYDRHNDVVREDVFPLKGKTTDDVTLKTFLKTFIHNRNKKDFEFFYLITNEPKRYKTNIKYLAI